MCKPYPNLIIDVTSVHISCKAGVEPTHFVWGCVCFCFCFFKWARKVCAYKYAVQRKCWCACRDALWGHVHSQGGMKLETVGEGNWNVRYKSQYLLSKYQWIKKGVISVIGVVKCKCHHNICFKNNYKDMLSATVLNTLNLLNTIFRMLSQKLYFMLAFPFYSTFCA